MRTIKLAFWAALALLAALWLAAEPQVLSAQGFFPLRGSMVQASSSSAEISARSGRGSGRSSSLRPTVVM
jgi:hypothetical protein